MVELLFVFSSCSPNTTQRVDIRINDEALLTEIYY